MTSGNIARLVVQFAFPLLLGNLFQQLYNTVDSVILGNYVGKEALAAVGASNHFVRTLVGFFMGFSTGGSIVISQFFGAKNSDGVKKTVHTILLSTVFLGVVFTFVGMAGNYWLLELNGTPTDIIDDAHIYLEIQFEGVAFLMLYNAGAGILRAVGDSKRPVYFLAASSLVNVVLDFVFVVFLGWGIAGASYATIISQAVSAFLTLFVLFRSKEIFRAEFRSLGIDFPILWKVLKLGVPGGLQLSITSFSNIFVQGYINSFGSDCVAGWTCFNKIDQFCILPIQSLQLSSTIFTGQNYGAGKLARARKGTFVTVGLAIGIAFALLLFSQIFAVHLVSVFNREEGVLYYGRYFLRVCSFFYVARIFGPIIAGSLRGLGNATVPMFILLFSYVAFRQIYLFVLTHLTSALFPVSLAYPVGWTMSSILMTAYYLFYTGKMK